MKKARKRTRRTKEEIELDEQDSPEARRESRKRMTAFDKTFRPIKRMKTAWQYLRLRFVNKVAHHVDIPLESFVRNAVCERAMSVLAGESTARMTYKRVLSNRYKKRIDIEFLDWRWREDLLSLAEDAARDVGTDLATFVDVATYEHAVRIVRFYEQYVGQCGEASDALALYLDFVKDYDL